MLKDKRNADNTTDVTEDVAVNEAEVSEDDLPNTTENTEKV